MTPRTFMDLAYKTTVDYLPNGRDTCCSFINIDYEGQSQERLTLSIRDTLSFGQFRLPFSLKNISNFARTLGIPTDGIFGFDDTVKIALLGDSGGAQISFWVDKDANLLVTLTVESASLSAEALKAVPVSEREYAMRKNLVQICEDIANDYRTYLGILMAASQLA